MLKGRGPLLEVANARTIAAALEEDDYHVLHLSGHGDETGIELEGVGC